MIPPAVLPIDVDVGGVATGVFLGLVVGVVVGVDLAWWMVFFFMEMWLVPWSMWFGDHCVAGDVVGDGGGGGGGDCNCPQSMTRHDTKNAPEIAHPDMDIMWITATVVNAG